MINKLNWITVILTGILLFSISCNQGKSPGTNVSQRTSISNEPGMHADQPGHIKAASQIIYDVEIINPYPDDPWTKEWLKHLDHKTAVNFVFAGLYSEKFKAYDIFEGTPISAKKIMKMESEGEFTREQIGKFQFMEEWILDTINMTFTKEVTEIRMGLQKINQDQELTGYAPLFRVVL